MLLRNSISKAKKLLDSTIQAFKSILSGGYERLPKTPPFNPFSCGSDSNMHRSFRELDSFYEEFTGRWAADQRGETKKKKDERTRPTKEEGIFNKEKDTPRQGKREVDGKRERRKVVVQDEEADVASHNLRVETRSIVARRLKELELMDVNDVDHVLDIEEVLHYYSRITCPFYVDIVNKFFMEIYAEFLIPQASPSASYISRKISYV